MHEAFVLSTPVRRAVFLDLASGETNLSRIVLKNRLLRPAAEKAAADFAERGLVKKDGDAWRMTEEGEKARLEIAKKYL